MTQLKYVLSTVIIFKICLNENVYVCEYGGY